MSAGKLATIVAVDVSGYSALAQANEAAAAAAVARLGKRCAKVAKKHGGRICNTAGDSVMMEFPRVSSALEAADELARNPDPPIRVGVHLGEVRPMPNGDLLGHGVSVATRLQALAQAGGVIVSEDARRALRGPMAERLVSRGVVTLDKLNENLAIYELTQDAEAVARTEAAQRAMRGARRTAIVGAAAFGAALAAALAWPLLQPPPPTRVAVFSLAAPADDAGLQALAGDLTDDITAALGAIGVQTAVQTEAAAQAQRLDRARDLHAVFAVEGAVERTSDNIQLTILLTRSSDGATLWSNAFEGSTQEARALRLQAAQTSADVLNCGVGVARRRRTDLEAQTFALMLRACGALREPDKALETRDMLAEVVAREPSFAYARALLALSVAMASQSEPEPARQALRETARAEAERAQRSDPNIGESYAALALLETEANWAARENLLQQGLDRDEENATLNAYYANLLLDVGRVRQALALAQRASALDPMSLAKRRDLVSLLLVNGDTGAARDIVENMSTAYPDDAWRWWARLRIALWGQRYDDVIAMIDAPASQAHLPRERQCLRQTVDAMRGTTPAALAARQVLQCSQSGHLAPNQALMLLAKLGALDDAFALAQQMFVGQPSGGYDVLYAPATAPMRADPRFMLLMRDLGLLRHWNLNGPWPDFCNDPSLPYRCQAEAIRLT